MKRFQKILLAIIGAAIFLVVVSLIVLQVLISPMNIRAEEKVRVIIPKGSGVISIGKILKEKGLVRSGTLFRYVVWREGLSEALQAGTFELSQSMDVKEIAKVLTKGTSDAWVTVIEGWRNEEIAAELEKQLTNFDGELFLRTAEPYTGTLFPDTYLFPKEATPSFIVATMNGNFNKKFPLSLHEAYQNQGRSIKEVLILASIVEREARQPESMKIVAGILLNRLDAGIALQVDATLQYIKGYSMTEKTWWPTPTSADKSLKSPYNTYLYPGLPPGPISNPGLNALTAVVYSTDTDYLYYITGKDNKMHYARTLEEHNENIRKYL